MNIHVLRLICSTYPDLFSLVKLPNICVWTMLGKIILSYQKLNYFLHRQDSAGWNLTATLDIRMSIKYIGLATLWLKSKNQSNINTFFLGVNKQRKIEIYCYIVVECLYFLKTISPHIASYCHCLTQV
jgi:hypothetical protein